MVESWITAAKRPAAEAEQLVKLFNSYVPSLLNFLSFECTPCMFNTPISLLTSMTVVLTALLADTMAALRMKVPAA